jgi:hypothetical protein
MKRMQAFIPCLVAVSSAIFVAGAEQSANAVEPLEPGSVVQYGDLAFYPDRWREAAVDTRLVPWSGEHVVFLTTRAEFDGQIMRRLLDRLDGAWALYGQLTGRKPRRLKHLDGKPTIAAVPSGRLTCGYGCGFVGWTGIEVAGFYDADYALLDSKPKAMPHYYFYEIGRNYYTFGHRHSLFTTGYAVFMRYVCMDTLACEDPDLATREVIESAEALFAQSDMSFLRGFTTLDGLGEKDHRLQDAQGRALIPSDQPVLYASAMLKLWRDHGGNAWLGRFFRHLAACDEIEPNDSDAALKQSLNWLVAASLAAEQDLSAVFCDRWRLPLDPEARRTLAAVDWKSPDTNAAAIVNSIRRDVRSN